MVVNSLLFPSSVTNSFRSWPLGLTHAIPNAFGTACATLKKYPLDFFNSACGGTEPQKAPNNKPPSKILI